MLGPGDRMDSLRSLTRLAERLAERIEYEREHALANDHLAFILPVSGRRFEARRPLMNLLRRGLFTKRHLVLLGEIAPKMLASSRPLSISRLVGGPILAVHTALLPFRTLLDRFVVRPLSRRAVPQQAATPLSLQELDALIDASASAGLVDPQEQRLLADARSCN